MSELLIALGLAAAGTATLWLIGRWERRREIRHAAWERSGR